MKPAIETVFTSFRATSRYHSTQLICIGSDPCLSATQTRRLASSPLRVSHGRHLRPLRILFLRNDCVRAHRLRVDLAVGQSHPGIIEDKPAFRIADGSFAQAYPSAPISSRSGLDWRVLRSCNTGHWNIAGSDLDRGDHIPAPVAASMTRRAWSNRAKQSFCATISVSRRSPGTSISRRATVPVHAVEMRIEADGRWKQCLAFSSRFDTRTWYSVAGWTCDAHRHQARRRCPRLRTRQTRDR